MTSGRRRVQLVVALSLVALTGTAIWLARSEAELPETVWCCLGTGEVRKTATSPTLKGFELYSSIGKTSRLYLREVPFMESARLRFSRGGQSIERPLYPMRPTGSKVAADGTWWEEYRVDPR